MLLSPKSEKSLPGTSRCEGEAQGQESGDSRWETMLQGLIEYKKQYNCLSIPRGYRWNGRNLYEFCRNQRKHYLNGLRGKTPALLPKRIERLQSIGFELDPTGVHGQNNAIDDQRWAIMFQGLEEFHRRHGTFAVPAGHLCDNKSLHDWIRHQRKQFSTIVDGKPALSAARIERLKSIGFDLDPTGRRLDKRSEQERWEIMFQGLVAFKERHGNFVIPEGYLHDNRSLFSWAHNQRRLYANHLKDYTPKLMPERIKRLQDIGFDLSPRRTTKGNAFLKRPRSFDSPVDSAVSDKRTAHASGRKDTTRDLAAAAIAAAYTSYTEQSFETQAIDGLLRKAISEYQSMTREERMQILNPSSPGKS